MAEKVPCPKKHAACRPPIPFLELQKTMSKRSHDGDETTRPPKRVKTQHIDNSKPPPPEEIHFARQLQTLLTFRQDGIPELRSGIASFKVLLESILYRKNEDDRGRQLSILREYLENERPKDKEEGSVFMGQLWQAWSFGTQNNVDPLVSSVSAVLALLMKTLSSLLDFHTFGVSLGRALLRGDNLKLVKWSLNAPRQKDFLISPCLRLLTEVASFDGGIFAREVYKNREQTFDPGVIRRNLGLVRIG
jgi:nucleolar pre-ribosomal-associated protein 1